VDARVGLALSPQDGREAEALVAMAEAALRTAKCSGERRGQFDAGRHSARLARTALERQLHGALERQQFERER
jgi:predicted signal transduction protein with EAL and GGDEF domain